MKLRTQVSALATSLLCASTLLAGCGGGGGGALPHTDATASAKTAKASFTIHWPQRAVSVTNAGRKPQFISPSTMAVIVEVNPNASTPGPVTFINNTGSSTSTLNLDAPVGNDEFIFTLWDKKQNSGETQPVGNHLGQADVSQAVHANKLNTVSAVIGGITAHVAMAPAANQTFVETDATGGYDLVGDTPVTFVATPYDADNNVIIGPGAPSLSYAVSSPSTGYISLQPVNGNANKFTVSAETPFVSSSPLSVVATATDSGVQHTTTSHLNVYQYSAMYVSYGSSTGTPMIALYDDRGNFIPLSSTAFSGLIAPAGVAYDTKTHEVFVADTGANAVRAFDALGKPVSGFTPVTLTGARGVAYDPQSDTLFATGASSVIAFHADGSSAPVSAGAWTQTSAPNGVAYVGIDSSNAPDDEIAVANESTKAIDYYGTNGVWIRSDTLTAPAPPALAAPMVGLAWNGGIYQAPVFAAGGPAGAGFAMTEAIFGGYSFDYSSSTATRYGGVAISQTHIHAATSNYSMTPYEGYFVLPDANQIQGYVYTNGNTPGFTYSDVLITTPASSGLSHPIGIAITSV